jgi:hypothetical protein
MPDNRFPYITSPNRIYNASYVHVFNPEDPVSVRHDSESNRHYSESNVDQIKIMAEKVLRVLRLALGRGYWSAHSNWCYFIYLLQLKIKIKRIKREHFLVR